MHGTSVADTEGGGGGMREDTRWVREDTRGG